MWTASLEYIAGSLPEHTPAAYLRAFHTFLWPGTQTPPFNQITHQGYQSTGIEQDSKNILILRENDPVKFWRPPPQFPDPLRIDSFMHHSIALDVRIPNMWFMFRLTRDAKNSWSCSLLLPCIHKSYVCFTQMPSFLPTSAPNHKAVCIFLAACFYQLTARTSFANCWSPTQQTACLWRVF